jgi:cytochrome o ubiquinol oxidase operon protein cyoD
MSAHDIHAGHDDHDDLHVTMGDYVKGFILAVILTAIPFYLVMNNVITDRTTAVAVLGLFAVIQVLVHMVYFLHMNGKIQGGWTMLSTIFTVIFLAIAISGTLWVMFHMNTNMMPGHEMHQAAGHADHAGHTAPAAVTP